LRFVSIKPLTEDFKERLCMLGRHGKTTYEVLRRLNAGLDCGFFVGLRRLYGSRDLGEEEGKLPL
jgi:hypothetical protein